ncbi:universal stress protein [Citricoccus sp. SGAir0253]|uniref:universal stress protein n=1 Tax=Citricoccus sp. SGAir0253 TaxID=2567881 RepID=UPI0010CCD9B7|nr:universal stress protein [Citricoccus sp. SGAir0253]QCU76887.1 universal stress protein [Citricoccus sp. SGAir0253]
MTGTHDQDRTPITPEQATTHGVVVGVDGSEQSVSAAKWAAREAEARNLPLTLVTAYTMPVFAASALEAGYGVPDDTMIRDGAMQVLQGVVNQIGTLAVPLVHRVEMGDAAGVLVDYSADANLLVAGTRGRGGFFGRLLGSVASALPAHAKCPVVIVPKGEHATRAAEGVPVVVGVDGSEQGRVAALAAALEAEVRHSPLRVVIAMPPISGAVAWLPATVDEQAMVEDMQEKLDAGAEWLRSEFPGLEVTAEIVDGVPVDVMVNESKTARLTVVGTRGHGGFTGALLGSTSQGVISHAHGPVMVVPYLKDSRLATRARFGPTYS